MPSTSATRVQCAAPSQQWFATTHWSVLRSAAETESRGGSEAVETLCRNYWQPVFNYVRRQGYTTADAQDITQGFFARLLEKKFWARADREKGRFRSFLLTALSQYLADQRDHARAAKRGGGVTLMSLDDAGAKETIAEASNLSCEQQFDRQWALAVVQQARCKLQQECAASGKAALYESLDALGGAREKSLTYVELAAQLGMTVSATKSAVSRLRERYAELVREEIGQTVATPAELRDEIAYLRSILQA
jgi:DNA-directed RNA polymerase specialized sigma24 family protein